MVGSEEKGICGDEKVIAGEDWYDGSDGVVCGGMRKSV